jgi:hypothetical protein
MNTHRPSAEGNFCDEQGKAQKPVLVADDSWYMGCINKGG